MRVRLGFPAGIGLGVAAATLVLRRVRSCQPPELQLTQVEAVAVESACGEDGSPSTARINITTDGVPREPVPDGIRRLRAEVLLGPVVLVLMGVVIDRLRESYAHEAVTAWTIALGGTLAFFLARLAGFHRAAAFYYIALVLTVYALLELYDHAPGGKLPDVWWWSTFVASLIWALGTLAERIRRIVRSVDRASWLDAAPSVMVALTDSTILGWSIFGLVFVDFASQLRGFIHIPIDQPEFFTSPTRWIVYILLLLSTAGIVMTGTLSIFPRRLRVLGLSTGVYLIVRTYYNDEPSWKYFFAIAISLTILIPNRLVDTVKTKLAWSRYIQFPPG